MFVIIFSKRCVHRKILCHDVYHQHHHHQFDDDDGGDHQIDGRGDDHKEDCGGCGIIKSVHGDAGNVRCSVGTGVDDEAAEADENNLMNSFILIYSKLYNICKNC